MFQSGLPVSTRQRPARVQAHCIPFDAGVARSEGAPSTRFALRVAAAAVLLILSVAGLYLVKSALRIDILPGPSPLHGFLYPIIERLR